MFPWVPIHLLVEDEMGVSQDTPQGERGEQGDPLMPMLFALGQHRALLANQERLLNGEKVFAFLDDIYVVCARERVGDVYAIIEEELFAHARISVHPGVESRGGWFLMTLTSSPRLPECGFQMQWSGGETKDCQQ